MDKLDTPKSQDSATKYTEKGKNSGTLGKHAPANTVVHPTADKNNNPKKHGDSMMRSWLREHITPNLVVQVFLLILGMYVACIYSGQLDAMRESNEISRDSLTKVQRAFVAVNPIPEIQTTNENGQQNMWFAFHMENFGATATRDLAAHVNWLKGSGPIPSGFTFPDAPDREGLATTDTAFPVIAPKGQFPLLVGPISRDFIEKLYKREMRLYVYGWVRYNDIFEKTPRHVTKFCYELVPGGIARTQSGQEGQGLRTNVIGPFNCYDEKCKE